MNREQANKYWQFIKAYGEGKELQYRKVGEIEWHDERKNLGFVTVRLFGGINGKERTKRTIGYFRNIYKRCSFNN